MQNRTEGRLYVTTGKSRSGKTALTMQVTRHARRLIVWDPKGAWAREANCERVTALSALVRVTRNFSGARRVAFVSPNPGDFDFWAQCAFWWGRLEPCAAVAEEIANVTSAGKAPQGWHLLLSQGLEFGIDIHALTQAITESDKTCVRNATVITTFQLARAQDRAYVAKEMDIDAQRIADLQPLAYIAREISTGKLEERKLKFAQTRAPAAEKAEKSP